MTSRDIDRIAAALAEASGVLFITGAGISADSGLPTYRGIGGLYDRDLTEDGVAIEDALSGEMLRRDPGLCWKYIRQIEEACRGATFNRGHEVIAELERSFPRMWVLTQNVDGFHRAAGSTNLIEMHGDIHRLSCIECDTRMTVSDYTGLPAVPDVPRCQSCSGLIRPDVVLFGEMLPDAEVRELRRQLLAGFDVVISIGTTSVFPYIAEPVHLARSQGGLTVEINPGQSAVSDVVDIRLVGRAKDELDAIARTFLG